MNICPVCGYNKLEQPPRCYFICPSCGTEFDLDDKVKTHNELRTEWLLAGAPWFDYGTPQPSNWNPYEQLKNIGVWDYVEDAEVTHTDEDVGELVRGGLVIETKNGAVSITLSLRETVSDFLGQIEPVHV